jgi:Zn-dependent peptidase ImmA (M78 family)
VPVDVRAISGDCGTSVTEEELEDSVSGFLVLRDGRGIIGVNRKHHPNRQRFTIAHELAHYLLHRDAASVFIDASPVFFRDETSSEGSKAQEIEANAFAAELLMPAAALRARVGNRPVDGHDEAALRRLASEFGVSPQALLIRLTRLDLISG